MNDLDVIKEIIEEAKTVVSVFHLDTLELLLNNAETIRQKAIYMIAIGMLESK